FMPRTIVTPTVVLRSSTPVKTIVATSSQTTTRVVTVNSAPRYNTVVEGVTADYVNQSLAQLRTSILSDVTNLVRPLSGQIAQNATTIQQVNVIQDLSNLILRNPDIRGGTIGNAL